MNRGTAIVAWVVLVVAGMVLGPANRPDLGAVLWAVGTGDLHAAPSWFVAQFQCMGLWPLGIALLLRGDLRGDLRSGLPGGRRWPAWPFVVGSFVLGCYVLLPWFALRSGPPTEPPRGRFSGWGWPALLAAIAAAWIGWGIGAGSMADWVHLARTDGFTWAMTWDFCAFWLISVLEARSRLRRAPWPITLVPLVGLGAALAVEALAPRDGEPAESGRL
jgi:hypothetical protein